jgi:hypothetical protein
MIRTEKNCAKEDKRFGKAVMRLTCCTVAPKKSSGRDVMIGHAGHESGKDTILE